MNPYLNQAVATERRNQLIADAAAARRTRTSRKIRRRTR
jgi:hypothetical protein